LNQLAKKKGLVVHRIFLQPADLEFRIGPKEMHNAPRGHYKLEMIVDNQPFYGHGNYPLEAMAKAARSAWAHFTSDQVSGPSAATAGP
jgi:hypothetical protein